MGLAATNDDGALLKNLVPLNALSDEQLGPLLSHISITKVKKGAFIFKEGDLEEQNIYLLTGKIALLADGKEVDAVHSGSETARYPLAHQFPRLFSAKAKTAVTYVSIDSRLLSDLLLRSQSESEEAETDSDSEGGDWMSQLLLSPIFQRIPPANMQQVMMRMEEVNLSAGDSVFQQGEEGEYYYMVSRGRCTVTRQASQESAPIKLAEISVGNSFGEEALLSQAPRSCTVTMQSDGLLVRLNKDDFLSLVSEPLSHPLSYEDATEKVEAGARWLDIRLPEAYEAGSLNNAINLPTFSLRYQLSDLSPEVEYITYGDTPVLAAAAAFILLEKGYVAYHLNEAVSKALVKQSSPVIDADELEESDAEELESSLEEAKENKQRLKQEQVKLRRLEKLYLKTKQDLDVAEKERAEALEAEKRAAKQLNQIEEKLNKSKNQNTELETMEHARDDALEELEELNESIKELRQSHLLREGELKEQITCLQIELDDIGETNETQQSEYAENQKMVAEVNQQLEASDKAHAEQQQAWQKEREQLENESKALKERLEALESESEASALKLQQEMEALQQELIASQQSNVSHEEELSKLKQSEQALLAKQLEQEKSCEELQSQLDELQSSGSSLHEEKIAQQAEIEKLTLELSSINEKMTLDSGEQSQQLEQIKSELAQEQEKFSSENEANLKQITSLEQRLEEAIATSSEQSKERTQQQEQIKALSQALEELTEQYEAEVSGRSELAVEKDEQLKQIAALEQQLEEATSAGDLQDEEQAQQQAQIETLTQELEKVTEQMAKESHEQSQQLEQLQNELSKEQAAFESEKEAQLKQVATLEQQLAEAASTGGALDEVRSQQQAQIETLTQELEKITEQHELDAKEQAQQIKLLQDELEQNQSDLAAEKESQSQQIDAALAAKKALEDDREAQQQQVSKLHQELEALNKALKQQKDDHQKSLEASQLQVKILESELQKSEQKIKEADSQLNEEKGEQADQIATLKQTLDDVQGKLKGVVESHQNEQSAAQAEIEKLKGDLEVSGATLAQQRADLESGNAEQLKQIETLQKQLDKLSKAEGGFDKERAAQQAEQQQKIEALEAKLKAAENEEEESIAAFQETIDELMIRKDDFKANCEQLQRQLEQMTEERNGQSKVMQRLTLQLDKLEAESSSTELTEQLEQSNSKNRTLQAERDAAQEQMKVAQGEVEELRRVMEQHVAQIKLAQSGDDDSEAVEALQRELETVRLQTSHDIKKLQCELELAQSQSVEERNPAQVAAEQQMRQELDSIQGALRDKEVLLNEASRSMRKMEDSLEERDTNADRLQLEIDRLQEMLDEMLQQQSGEPLSGEYIDAGSESSNDSSMLKRMFKSKKKG